MKTNSFFEKIYYIIAPISVLISTLFAMSLQPIIDSGMSSKYDTFFSASIFAIFFCLLDIVFIYIANVLENNIKATFIANFRLCIFDKLFSLKISEFNTNLSTDFITDLTTRPDDLSEKLCSNKLQIYKNIWSLIISVIAIISTRWELAVYIIVFSFISVYLPKLFQSKSIQYENEYIENTNIHTQKTNELIRNFGIIKIYNIIQIQRKKFQNVIYNVKNTDIKRNNKTNTLNSISIGSSELSFACIVIFSTILVLKGKLSVGYILSISQLLGGIMSPFEVLPGYIMEYITGKKIYKNILGNYESLPTTSSLHLTNCSSIKLENVVVKKESSIILDNINLHFNLNKKYAIIGKSGAGKSTLAKTIMNLVDTDAGNILYDNYKINEFNKEDIFNFINYQNQKLSMLDESIKDNIVLFKGYDFQKWSSVIKDTALTDFINKKANRENTILLDDAKNISGGELQRIAIARSLYSSAKFMIFDECLANLDNPTAMQIEKDLLLNSKKGLLMITHRIFEKNMRLYDYVILLEKGKIIEFDKWDNMKHKNFVK